MADGASSDNAGEHLSPYAPNGTSRNKVKVIKLKNEEISIYKKILIHIFQRPNLYIFFFTFYLKLYLKYCT